MDSEPLVHVFLVSFPGQGHVNPLLRLGKRLASKGLLVTFSTTQNFGNQMRKANRISDELSPVGEGFIGFEFFDDGWEGDDPRRFDLDAYLVQLELVGKELLPRIINKHAEQGRPISCLINNPFIPWVSDMAESLGIPSAMLWVQSCACFASYYHYFHGLVPFPSDAQPFIDVQLPCMPLLKYDEVPSFLYPTTPYPFLKTAILAQYNNLEKSICILMDTFQELEHEIIDYMSNLCPIKTVGPLFKNTKQADSSSIRGDMFEAEGDCLEWLDSKPPSSIVYISFGSVVSLKKEQADEIAYGILNSGVSFLWVIRPPTPILNKDSDQEFFVFQDGFLEKAGDRGKVVKWSPQEKVLAHPSVACFVSHCGWNSTIEAVASGIPVVAFPQWGDQVTDAKFLVDEFKVGLRLCRGEAHNKLIDREEVEKCLLEATIGPKSEEMKRNVLKLKEKAEASVAEGGSSDRNIQAFVDDVRRRSIALNGIADLVSKSTPNGVAEIVV